MFIERDDHRWWRFALSGIFLSKAFREVELGYGQMCISLIVKTGSISL